MIVTKEIPLEGHFIALWVYEGHMHCDSLRWEDGELEYQDSTQMDSWGDAITDFYSVANAIYLVLQPNDII